MLYLSKENRDSSLNTKKDFRAKNKEIANDKSSYSSKIYTKPTVLEILHLITKVQNP